MTVGGGQEPRVRRERRIIERPRLIKLLDESEAQIILLLAPAGYGKTTLARQWAKTLNRAIWVTLTPAHRDVVTVAGDLLRAIDLLGGAATQFVREYLRAQDNPQRSALDVAVALANQMNQVEARWLVLDDCHEIAGMDEPSTIFSTILARFEGRVLLTSRIRPSWLSHRRSVYGEVEEIDRSALAMTREESSMILGRRADSAALREQADGWPAALSLAAGLDRPSPPPGALPDALHHYLAEELFRSASENLRNDLMTLALLPQLDSPILAHELQEDRERLLAEARELGFVAVDADTVLHPLLREFLFSKLLQEPNASDRVEAVVKAAIEAEEWEHALSLVLRFRLDALIDDALTHAFTPLTRTGRLGTLSAFAANVRLGPNFPPPTIDLVDAEVALREGQLELAIELAARARARFRSDHALRSRAGAIMGHGHFLLASFDAAERAFTAARTEAVERRDAGEAVHGLVLTKVFGEREGVEPVLAALAEVRHESPAHLLRYATAELNRRRFTEGLRPPLGLEQGVHCLSLVDDPRARTSFTYSVAYALALRGDYEEAKTHLTLFLDDVHAFDLEFALPYADWTAAMISLGERRFGDAQRALQSVEDAARRPHQHRHAVNARSLRARLLLQIGNPDEALQQVRREIDVDLIPSWLGEYLATRALVLACLSDYRGAERAAEEAVASCQAVEIKVFAAAATAIARADDASHTRGLFRLAAQFDIWDPVICALRVSPSLADRAGADETLRPVLEDLYERSRDLALAKRAGFRTRSTRNPTELLSPREREVLGLIAAGLHNREIAEALFIANSTTKVHVRHILEKLGVKTRAEAVARYEMFATRRGTSSVADD